MYGEVLYSENGIIDRIRSLIKSIKDALNKKLAYFPLRLTLLLI